MEELNHSGKVRTIAVSKFSTKKLQFLLETARVPPADNQVECHPAWQQHKLRLFCWIPTNLTLLSFMAMKRILVMHLNSCPPVNQVECHPAWQQHKLCLFCKSNEVHLSGYSPMGSQMIGSKENVVLNNPVIGMVAEKLDKTRAQVALRSAGSKEAANSLFCSSTRKVCKSVIDLEYTFTYLRILYLSKSEVEFVSSSVGNLLHLRYFDLSENSKLVKGMENMTALQVLRLQDCAELTLGDFNLSSLISLETLEICNCLKLDLVKRRKTIREDVPKSRKSLQTLTLGNKKKLNEEKGSEAEKPEEELEDFNLGGLRKLQFLVISGLLKLNNLPEWFQNASDNIHYLTIGDCNTLLVGKLHPIVEDRDCELPVVVNSVQRDAKLDCSSNITFM
ncbi:hypothetical protein ACFE04_014686 [Oxalis oulophora]